MVLKGSNSQGPQTDRDSGPFYLCPLPSSPLHPQLRGSRGGEPRKAFPRGWGWARAGALVSWSLEQSAGGWLAPRSALCYSSLPIHTPGRSRAESDGVGPVAPLSQLLRKPQVQSILEAKRPWEGLLLD